MNAAKDAAQPTDRPPRPWFTRADVMASLFLTIVFLAWVAVIAVQQARVGRDIAVLRGEDSASLIIDLNTAPAGELMLLPGIGEKRAARLVEARSASGPFKTLEDARRAAGLSERQWEALADMVALKADGEQ